MANSPGYLAGGVVSLFLRKTIGISAVEESFMALDSHCLLRRNIIITYMEHPISINLENTYWSLLKGLSSEMKIRLIKRLAESFSTVPSDCPEKTADKYYGAWKDDKSA